MVIAQLISLDSFVTMSLTVYGKLKFFVDKQFIGDFSVVLMNKKCVKNAICHQESPLVSDSGNSVIM